MKLAILLGAITIALSFIIPQVAAKYGSDVGGRFLERNPQYTAQSLRDWMAIGANTANARGYAVPVLFPLDLFFLLAFGGFLACGSFACAQSIPGLRSIAWLFAVLPLVYLAADLIEDCLLARLLRDPATITDAAVGLAKSVTTVKIYSSVLALVQTVALAAASLFFR